MRYNGEELRRAEGIHQIFRVETIDGKRVVTELPVRIQALPPGWHERAARAIPMPIAPLDGTQTERPGQAPVANRNEEDPGYLDAIAERDRMISAWAIFDGTIQSEDTILFDTPAEEVTGDPVAFCQSVLAELIEALGEGELPAYAMAINTIGQVGGGDIALAEARMFHQRVNAIALQAAEEDGGEPVHAEVSGESDPQGNALDASDVGGAAGK